MDRADIFRLVSEHDGQPETKGLPVPVLPEFLVDRIEREVRGLIARCQRAEATVKTFAQREADLLEANNRYLQEARDARAEVRGLEAEIRMIRNTLKVTH